MLLLFQTPIARETEREREREIDIQPKCASSPPGFPPAFEAALRKLEKQTRRRKVRQKENEIAPRKGENIDRSCRRHAGGATGTCPWRLSGALSEPKFRLFGFAR